MDLVSEIHAAVKRAEKMGFHEHDSKVAALKSMSTQYQKKGKLTDNQQRYMNSLLKKFSEEELKKFQEWEQEWRTDEHIRERGDIISKYYIAQGSWFMGIAQKVQSCLNGVGNENLKEDVPNFYQFHRMTLNEYAEKVWKSHTAPLIWNEGDLVSVRSSAKVEGYTYQLRQQGININNNPCLVLGINAGVIQNAVTYNEKTGGARWISINPIGTTHIFQVMEKDLKKYRQPKKQSKK